MLTKALHQLILICVGSLLLGGISRAQDDDAQARPLFDKMLTAMDVKNYEAFVADANDTLRGALTKTQFLAVATTMDAKGSRDVTFLGELNQHGYEVYLYRIRYQDGDVLGTMALKDGKVAGIFYK